MAFLKLQIMDMPENMLGTYSPPKDSVPSRFRFLHPAAAQSFIAMDAEKRVKVSDCFRSAQGSLDAVQAGRGAQHPSFSGHNYGFSIDIDVDWMTRKHAFSGKRALDDWMESHGWHCFRKDHANEKECWHYNYFGPEAPDLVRAADGTNEASLERKILHYYGGSFGLTESECQDALKRMGWYAGEIDGDFGRRSKEAMRKFQDKWALGGYWRSKEEYERRQLGPVTRRTLAFVEAELLHNAKIPASTL